MKRRWQDWMNLALGSWLFFSPFLLDFVGGPDVAATWNAFILGIGIVLFSAAALAKPGQWQEWVNIALGAWLLIAPWVLGFADDNAATWNHVLVGLAVGGDAIWALARDQQGVHYG